MRGMQNFGSGFILPRTTARPMRKRRSTHRFDRLTALRLSTGGDEPRAKFAMSKRSVPYGNRWNRVNVPDFPCGVLSTIELRGLD